MVGGTDFVLQLNGVTSLTASRQ